MVAAGQHIGNDDVVVVGAADPDGPGASPPPVLDPAAGSSSSTSPNHRPGARPAAPRAPLPVPVDGRCAAPAGAPRWVVTRWSGIESVTRSAGGRPAGHWVGRRAAGCWAGKRAASALSALTAGAVRAETGPRGAVRRVPRTRWPGVSMSSAADARPSPGDGRPRRSAPDRRGFRC